MNDCQTCKYLFCDHSVGYYECQRENDMSDTEWDYYEENGYGPDCPYYEKEKGE